MIKKLILVCLFVVLVAQMAVAMDITVILSENNGNNPLYYYFKLDDTLKYSLFDVMQKYFVITHDNGYITAIQGKEATTQAHTAWMYDINGEMALVGAKDYIVKDGDLFSWDLRKW